MKKVFAKECIACKESFKSQCSYQLYCSVECRRSREPYYLNRELLHKVCGVCKDSFDTYRKAQKYCSPECHRVRWTKAFIEASN